MSNIVVFSILFCLAYCWTNTDALPGYIEEMLERNENDSFISFSIKRPVPNTDTSLEQVSIVFRHGDRLPDRSSIYPNSPYKAVSFYPYTYGDLTREGQNTMYKRGLELRLRLNAFLGDSYYTNILEAISSSYSRCQMSLQSLLTGLFGNLKDVPIKRVYWQAIPYSIIPADQDHLISVFLTCPLNFAYLQLPPTSDPEVQLAYNVVRNYSGYPEAVFRKKVGSIYDYLKTTNERGLPIPNDFKPYYPELLRKVGMLEWDFATKINVRFGAALLRRITESAIARVTNTLQPEDRKLFLYAGHDLNILLILQALNVDWKMEEVNYGAYVLFELHDINGAYGFKVYYQNNYVIPKLLNIRGCGTFCLLTWFMKRIEQLEQIPWTCD